MNKIVSLSVIALLMGTSSAFAAGYHVNEYSTTSVGRALAGVGMVADDYSALGYNPAGMSFNEKSGMQAGATYVGVRSTVAGTVNYTANPVTGQTPYTRTGTSSPYIARVLPEVFAQYKLNDQWTWGAGFYVPYGLATDYKNTWFGNAHALRSEIRAIDYSTGFSYRPIDEISLAVALNVQHASATLTNKVERGGMYLGDMMQANLEGEDWGVGYTLGAAFEPVKGTRFGVSYRSKISHDLRGHMDFDGANRQDVHAKITTPEVVTISGYQKVGKQLGLSATARWTRWSRFNTLNINRRADGATLSKTVEHWENQWFFALGADYQVIDGLTFRVGTAYDQAAVQDPQYRTARIPDARRIWTSVGASYAYKNWQFDAGYAHLFIKAATAEHGSEGSSDFHAKYASEANIVSANIQYKF